MMNAKTKHCTGFKKYLYLLRAFDKELLNLPLPFVWFMLTQMRYEKFTVHNNRIFINTTYAPFPSGSYNTAIKNFYRLARGYMSPFSAYISLTNQCPFNCWHCSNAYASDLNDMSTEEVQSIIKQLQKAGVSCIGFTGGEPTVREDLETLISHVDERSYTILFTTGYYIDYQRAQSLKDSGLSVVVVSLDSHIKEEHNMKRQWSIAFDEALVAIQACLKAGIYTAVSMVMTKDMLYSQKFRDFVYFLAKTGIQEIRILDPKPCGKLNVHSEEILSAEDQSRIRSLQYEINRDPSLPSIMAYAHISSAENFGCNGGRTHVYINAQGDLCPCDFTPLAFGNLKNETFHAVYQRMQKHFPCPSSACILASIAPSLEESRKEELPIKDTEKINDLLRQTKDTPLPRFFLKIGMKTRLTPLQKETDYARSH